MVKLAYNEDDDKHYVSQFSCLWLKYPKALVIFKPSIRSVTLCGTERSPLYWVFFFFLCLAVSFILLDFLRCFEKRKRKIKVATDVMFSAPSPFYSFFLVHDLCRGRMLFQGYTQQLPSRWFVPVESPAASKCKLLCVLTKLWGSNSESVWMSHISWSCQL